jgi:MFS family permease
MPADRNIRALMAFSVLIGLAIGLNFTMLPIHIINLRDDLFWVGFINSLQYLALVIMTFVWGAFSDKIGKRKAIIIGGNLVASVFYFFFPTADIITLTILRGIQVFFMASWILAYAMATEYRPKAKGEIIGWFTVFNALGWGTGSLLSGFLYDFDVGWFFYFTGIFNALAALVLLPAADPPLKKTSTSYMVFTIFSVYLKENGIPLPAIGVVVALSGLPSAGLGSIVGKLTDKYGRKPILLAAIIMYAAIWFTYGIVDNIWVVIVLWFIPVYVFYTISTTAYISDLTPSHQRGRGIGLLNSFYNLGAFVGSLAGGALAASQGYQPTFLVAALAIVVSFFIALKLKETKKDDES